MKKNIKNAHKFFEAEFIEHGNAWQSFTEKEKEEILGNINEYEHKQNELLQICGILDIC